MYVAMRTPVGQMMHDLKVPRERKACCIARRLRADERPVGARGKGARVEPLSTRSDCGSFLVRAVAFLEDNFAYLVIDKSTGRTAIVEHQVTTPRCLAHFKDLQLQYDEAKAARVESGGDAQSGDDGMASLDGALLDQVQNRPELTTALVTHHHLDHAGASQPCARPWRSCA